MNIKICDAIELLNSNDNFLILTHKDPDGDTLGSAFALCRVLLRRGKSAKVACPGTIPDKYGYLYNDIKNSGELEPEYIIAVDVADTALLDEPYRSQYENCINLCIDHHISNTGYAENLLLDSEASAAGEVIYDLLYEMGEDFDIFTANCLYTAIATDTGCFKYSNNTPKSMRIAAKLMETGIDVQRINRLMFETRSAARVSLEMKVLESLVYDVDGKCASIFIMNDMIEATGANDGDWEGLSAIPRTIEGVECGITFRQSKGGFKISVRTTPSVDASRICSVLGGGGHRGAAGCFVKGSREEVYKKVLDVVKNKI